RLHMPQQIEPAHAGHAYVGEDQVDRLLAQQLEGARRAVGHLHAEALLAEEELQDLPDVRIVLDHQDLGLLRRADGGDGLGMGHVRLAPRAPCAVRRGRPPWCVSGYATGVPSRLPAAPAWPSL